jgi:hypothetical protein
MNAGVVQMRWSTTGVQVYMCTTGILVYYMGTGTGSTGLHVYRCSKGIQAYMTSTMCTRHVKWYRFTGVLEYCMSTWFSEKYICTRVQQLNMGTGLQDWYRCIGV